MSHYIKQTSQLALQSVAPRYPSLNEYIYVGDVNIKATHQDAYVCIRWTLRNVCPKLYQDQTGGYSISLGTNGSDYKAPSLSESLCII